MLKLIKYEFKKQAFSKVVIAIILGILTLYFMYGIILDRQDDSILAVALMSIVMVCGSLYVALESMITYGRELKTKQSYLLFLIPQSSTKILGSKFLAAILQILFTMVMYGVVALICGGSLVMRYTTAEERKMLQEFMREAFKIKMDVTMLFQVFFSTFIIWTLMVVAGYFVSTLMNTILPKGRWITFLVIVAYFVALSIISKGSDYLYLLPVSGNYAFVIRDIISAVYIIAVELILFFASAWLVDKKLSV